MTMKNKQSNWLNEFIKWASTPCPDGEWIYRGQSAKHRDIVAKLKRKEFESLYRSEFYDMNYELAEKIFTESPGYQERPLFPYTIDDPLGLRFQRAAYSLIGGPPSSDPRLSFPEVVRALAQHYEYATLFIDVSFNPIVAALFASHKTKDNSFKDKSYIVNEEEEGIVFRWPAKRKSNSRLVIGSETGDSTSVNVIDISNISPYMRRPHNQRAALATPVYDPKPVYQPIHSPITDLINLPMEQLSCCETFIIPSGGGKQLNELQGVSMDGLFPDAIDLGYSYISMIALLSILYPSSRTSHLLPPDKNRDNFWRRTFKIVHAVLDRECLRVIPGLPIPEHFSSMTIYEAFYELDRMKDIAIDAIEMMHTEDMQKKAEPINQKYLEEVQAEHDKRHDAWHKSVQNVVGPEKAEEWKQPKQNYYISNSPRHSKDWIIHEFDTRIKIVESIIETVSFAPIYALEQPEKFPNHINLLPSNKDYEDKVKKQMQAQKQWLECPLFTDYLYPIK